MIDAFIIVARGMLSDPLILLIILIVLIWLELCLHERRVYKKWKRRGPRPMRGSITNPHTALEYRLVDDGIIDVEILGFVGCDMTHYRVRDNSGAVWWVQPRSMTLDWESEEACQG